MPDQDPQAEATAVAAGVTDPTVRPALVVPESATTQVLTTVLRYLLTALGAWLVARGWFESGLVNDVIGGALIVLPTALGGWLSRHHNEKLKLLEAFVPNRIAYRVR